MSIERESWVYNFKSILQHTMDRHDWMFKTVVQFLLPKEYRESLATVCKKTSKLDTERWCAHKQPHYIYESYDRQDRFGWRQTWKEGCLVKVEDLLQNGDTCRLTKFSPMPVKGEPGYKSYERIEYHPVLCSVKWEHYHPSGNLKSTRYFNDKGTCTRTIIFGDCLFPVALLDMNADVRIVEDADTCDRTITIKK